VPVCVPNLYFPPRSGLSDSRRYSRTFHGFSILLSPTCVSPVYLVYWLRCSLCERIFCRCGLYGPSVMHKPCVVGRPSADALRAMSTPFRPGGPQPRGQPSPLEDVPNEWRLRLFPPSFQTPRLLGAGLFPLNSDEVLLGPLSAPPPATFTCVPPSVSSLQPIFSFSPG